MSEEFLLIGFDLIVISIPHNKIRKHYLTKPPLVHPCGKTGSLMKQQFKLPFYLAVQMIQSILQINQLQLGSSRFPVVSLVVGLSPASLNSCRSVKKYDSIYAK